jgi:flagellar export protein FliJ
MSKRIQRIQKLTSLRQRELDNKLVELAASQKKLAEAEDQVRQESERLERANATHRRVLQGGGDAGSVAEAWDWLVERSKRRDQATLNVRRAEQVARRAQTAAVAARNEVKKLELLAERLASEHRVEESRAERKLEDELSRPLDRGDASRGSQA